MPMPASSSSFLKTSGGWASCFCIWLAHGSTPWNPKRAAILNPVSGCGFRGVNMLVLIDQRNRSDGSANAFVAARAPTVTPMKSRRVSMKPPVARTLDLGWDGCQPHIGRACVTLRFGATLGHLEIIHGGLMRLVSRLILCGLMASSLVRAQQAPTAPSQPAVLTADEDHKRIMDLLKISGFPPSANPSSPDTYNEALASPYPTLPDPLTMKNGQKVTTAAMWRTRRTELIDVFEREIYGRR